MKLLFSFKGRLSRKMFTLMILPAFAVYCFLFFLPFRSTLIFNITMVGMLIIMVSYISIMVRRLHDIGKHGIHILLLAIPIYNFYLFYLLFTRKGESGENEYGDDPLSAV